MLKNKTIFKSIAVALIMFMMVAALSPSVGMVYAITGSNGATGTTDVNYEVDQTGWTFSVPAAQTFTKGNLTLYGNVSISPESGKDIISLPSGQTINMIFTAANFNNGVFELRNGSNSVIPYKIGEVTRIASEGVSEEVSDITSNDCTVLTYIAGSSSNEGVTNKLRFATTLENIKNAKVTGLHTDTLTFTVNVTGGTSGGGSESGGGSSESGSEGSIGYTANFVVDANLPEIACTINGSTYNINELPSAVINVDTIEFFYVKIGPPSRGTKWDIGTSSGSNDIGTIKAGDSARLTYTMTADTTIFIKEGSATTSTFTIDGTEYEFEEGMTWADWVNSDYNTAGFYLKNDHLIEHPVNNHICYDWANEIPTNLIVADRQYYIGMDKSDV